VTPKRAALGGLAAALWCLTCVAWFDVGAAWRPAWLGALPVGLLAASTVLTAAAWVWDRRADLVGAEGAGARGAWLFVVGVAVFFRLPLAWNGAAGYVTPDGALSGLVALHLRDGIEHLVFVPQVAYSGSLKSHLTAVLALFLDPARAFALASVVFYAAFVAAVFRLASLAAPGRPWVATAAGMYLAMAPVFLTRYSLSNDGNYVEVLAFGTWALVLTARWLREETVRATLSLVIGTLLGLAFWCHVLALFHVVTVGLALLVATRLGALPSLVRVAGGFALGVFPSLLWNAANGWETLHYLAPGGAPGADAGDGLAGRAWGLLADHWPVLMGYDLGYARGVSILLGVCAALAMAASAWSVAYGFQEARTRRDPVRALLLLFLAVNVGLCWLALPYIPGNPRYLQFAAAPLAVLLALAFELRPRLMVVLVCFGALGSLAQVPGAFRADAQWRAFVRDLDAAGVRRCYTDFFLATKVNFLSSERIVCSAKLGPTTTEYFLDYRRQVEEAPTAAFIAVNPTAAEKLERRLERLGVTYERRDLMKPVLLRFSRKVDPAEVFPDRSFPVR
jgi:hypothetical protein